jgi:DNA-binding response OmpR family regulator
MKILLLEDDRTLHNSLKAYLEIIPFYTTNLKENEYKT